MLDSAPRECYLPRKKFHVSSIRSRRFYVPRSQVAESLRLRVRFDDSRGV
jgi:hypothetical protein